MESEDIWGRRVSAGLNSIITLTGGLPCVDDTRQSLCSFKPRSSAAKINSDSRSAGAIKERNPSEARIRDALSISDVHDSDASWRAEARLASGEMAPDVKKGGLLTIREKLRADDEAKSMKSPSTTSTLPAQREAAILDMQSALASGSSSTAVIPAIGYRCASIRAMRPHPAPASTIEVPEGDSCAQAPRRTPSVPIFMPERESVRSNCLKENIIKGQKLTPMRKLTMLRLPSAILSF